MSKNLILLFNSKNKIFPTVDLINLATIVNMKFYASIIDPKFFKFKNSNDGFNYIIKNFGKKID